MNKIQPLKRGVTYLDYKYIGVIAIMILVLISGVTYGYQKTEAAKEEKNCAAAGTRKHARELIAQNPEKYKKLLDRDGINGPCQHLPEE